MNSHATERSDLVQIEISRKSLWDIIQKTPALEPVEPVEVVEAEPSVSLAEEAPEPAEPPVEPVINEARELPEAKLLKQLNEMTHLLQQQTTILYAQQKLLEDLTAREKKPQKRKPSAAKKLKNLIHKGKVIWSAL